MRIITWPEGVAAEVGLGIASLKAARANGDAPELYAVSERHLVTTDVALAEWVRAKKVPVTYRCRPPTRRPMSPGEGDASEPMRTGGGTTARCVGDSRRHPARADGA